MNPSQPFFSIISPVYRAEKIVDLLVQKIEESVQAINPSFEIILVEDGGPDNSWDKIVENCRKNPKVRGIKLSRNFGQHAAITAGLEAARGEWIVVMDCDLQDDPEEIPRLFQKAQEGYDLVFAQRIERQDGFFKRLSSRLFYGIFSYLTDTPQDSSIANFGIYHRKVIQAILQMGDYIRYFPTQCRWVGFRKVVLPVVHASRHEGKSSYSLRRLLQLAANNILSFSEKPLWLMVKFGVLTTFLSIGVGVYYSIKFLLGQISEPGYTSLILSIWFALGMLSIMLGIVGIYVGKTFEKTKNRPVYIVQEELNGE